MTNESNSVVVYLQYLYPVDAPNIQVILINFEDKEFCSRAIVARDDGQLGRTLFTGTKGHGTPEASAEDLLFMIIKHVAQLQNVAAPSREEFDDRVKINWQEKQEQNRREEEAEAAAGEGNINQSA